MRGNNLRHVFISITFGRDFFSISSSLFSMLFSCSRIWLYCYFQFAYSPLLNKIVVEPSTFATIFNFFDSKATFNYSLVLVCRFLTSRITIYYNKVLFPTILDRCLGSFQINFDKHWINERIALWQCQSISWPYHVSKILKNNHQGV